MYDCKIDIKCTCNEHNIKYYCVVYSYFKQESTERQYIEKGKIGDYAIEQQEITPEIAESLHDLCGLKFLHVL